MDEDDPWGLRAALTPRRALVEFEGPSTRRLVIWGLAALLAVGLLVADALLAARPHPAPESSAPSSSARPTASATRATGAGGTPDPVTSIVPKPLAAYVFPSAVGSYVFISRGRIGDDEVGYYSGSKNPLMLHKKVGTTLVSLTKSASEVTRGTRFWCWRNDQSERVCGTQFRDGVLLQVVTDAESLDTVQKLMTEVVKGY